MYARSIKCMCEMEYTLNLLREKSLLIKIQGYIDPVIFNLSRIP